MPYFGTYFGTGGGSVAADVAAGDVASVLDLMALLDNELDVGAGEVDEAQAILALRQAQHYFELLAAATPRVLQDALLVATAADTETSSWSSSLRRLDALWYLDVNGNPITQVRRIDDIGGHVPSLPWPLQISLGSLAEGAPLGYYANMRDFYWLPKPDGTYAIRIYGFFKQSEFVDRSSAYGYPAETKLAFASFANKLMSTGVGDASADYGALATQLFGPILRGYRKFDRSRPTTRVYSEWHYT